MDTAWIQVFVLTISECVAPAGKTVCQEQALELQFLTEEDCRKALDQLVELKKESERVIVDEDAAQCVPTGREQEAFASAAALDEAFGDVTGWRKPDSSGAGSGETLAAHTERLESLPSCEESGGEKPCRVGSIILEREEPRTIEVWQRRD